ncbi:MAG: hypothetical protein KF726_08975 [Anaerolineae bacterium]|nr:hypothetical protein [Anaerolineae bacterium]
MRQRVGWYCFAVVILALAFLQPVSAQDRPLTYGTTISGELTEATFEAVYGFAGQKGDVILVRMAGEEGFDSLRDPVLQVLFNNQQVIGDTSRFFGVFGEALLVLELPADADYSIVATRRGGRTGKSTGKFTLELMQPPALKLEQPITDSVNNKSRRFYTVVATPNLLFTVAYRKLSGMFYPKVVIHGVEQGELQPRVKLIGDGMWSGQIGYLPQMNERWMIVSVGKDDELTGFDLLTAEYSIMLVADISVR